MSTRARTYRRAIGIVRVSEVRGREGESFASPLEQRERMEAVCEREGLRLLYVLDELDVSGGTPLDRRAGLRAAVEAIEAGEADVIVAAYFDRLVRSLRVQSDLLERVEAAGGSVFGGDVGTVGNGSAGQWLNATMLGMVAEYQRRSTAERTAEAQRRAVERGVPPYAKITPGYLRGADGRLAPDPTLAPVIVRAFEMRAESTPIKAIRAFLAEHGIDRSHHGVDSLLASPVVLGELRFGELVNRHAHEPIVDRALWQRVQRVKVPRGRQGKSARLLARLGILRCATCGARMVVGGSQNLWPQYRCPPTGDCMRKAAISAEKIESIVSDAVCAYLADAEGRASAQSHAREAERAAERSQAELDAAIRVLSDFGDEVATVERLAELRDARDAARDQLDRLSATGATVTVHPTTDWETATLAERRALIRATVARVTVAPGRGMGRVGIEMVGE